MEWTILGARACETLGEARLFVDNWAETQETTILVCRRQRVAKHPPLHRGVACILKNGELDPQLAQLQIQHADSRQEEPFRKTYSHK